MPGREMTGAREGERGGEKNRGKERNPKLVTRFLSGKQYAIQLKMAPDSPPASFSGQLLIRLNGAHGSSQFISFYK